jgi:2-dehydropantoate 2-reductase
VGFEMTAPHWHVLGAGAIGCLYADALQRGGSKTTLVLRANTPKNSRRLIVERDGKTTELAVPVVSPDDRPRISHLLVTTKAYDVREAIAGVAPHILDQGVVVLMVNGLGLIEELSEEWPHLDIFCGTTTAGAYRIADQHIHHAGRGDTRIGRQGLETSPHWFDHWENSIKNCVWDSNIETALWSKLAANCVINPLTALHGCTNGELGRHQDLAQKVTLLCEEVAQISRAAGYSDIAVTLPNTVATIIAGTAENRSSMLQDVESGRRTEIDYITGHLLNVAKQHGLDAPLNRALLEHIAQRDH